MDYDDDFPRYVPVAQRRARAQKEMARLRKQGAPVRPVVIEGRQIAKTFWGKSWCKHLEAYSDFASRLPRGRTYARNGSVVDLQIETGHLTAWVSGSDLYRATVKIETLDRARWKKVVRECSGRIDTVVELLTGNLSSGVMEVLCRRDSGMFPLSPEISLSCSCPDSARLCKHLAAVLYGVGARLDQEPELIFVLRGVDKMDLIAEAGHGGKFGKQTSEASTLAEDSLAGIFGIELDAGPKAPAKKPRKRSARE